MNRNAIATLTAAATTLTLALVLATPAHAYKIGGNVTQTADVGNVVTSAAGSRVYARTDLNTIYDGGNIGGSVKQTLKAKNVITSAAGSRATACTSINVIGQKDCSQR